MPKLSPIKNYRLNDHARFEMTRRQISDETITQVLANPDDTETVRAGRAVYQSQIEIGDPAKIYLIRIFVDVDRTPPEVVTVYRTSKVAKYWRSE